MAVTKITIKSGQVSGTQTNMPLLLTPSLLRDASSTLIFPSGITLAEAQSLRIYSNIGLTTELAREVVSADEIHFKAASATSLDSYWIDIDGVRADYAVTDTYGRNAVWSDYITVLHFEGGLTNSVGANDGTVGATDAPSYASQKIGQGATFNTTASRIDVANQTATYYQTLSIFGKTTNSGGTIFFANDTKGSNSGNFAILKNAANKAVVEIYRNNPTFVTYSVAGTTNINTGNFFLLHASKENGTIRIYVNGAQEATTTNTSIDTGGVLYISQDSIAASMDELRNRKSLLSANWIATEQNNLSANGSFWEGETSGGSPTSHPNLLMMGIG